MIYLIYFVFFTTFRSIAMKIDTKDVIKKLKCIIVDDERHAVAELQELLQQISVVEIAATFLSAREALTFLQTATHIDIVFSDVHMPFVNGIEAGKLFKLHSTYLVYVTAYRDFAVEAIRVNTNGYLLKPVNFTEVLELVNRIADDKAMSESLAKENDFMIFKGGQKHSYFKVMTREILYIEGMANYVRIHTTKGINITYTLIKDIEERLRTKNIFVRIAKSTIISLLFLDRIDGNMVYLDNKENFPVGIPYQKEFYRILRDKYDNGN